MRRYRHKAHSPLTLLRLQGPRRRLERYDPHRDQPRHGSESFLNSPIALSAPGYATVARRPPGPQPCRHSQQNRRLIFSRMAGRGVVADIHCHCGRRFPECHDGFRPGDHSFAAPHPGSRAATGSGLGDRGDAGYHFARQRHCGADTSLWQCRIWLLTGQHRPAVLLPASAICALLLNEMLKFAFRSSPAGRDPASGACLQFGISSSHAALSSTVYFRRRCFFGAHAARPGARLYLLWFAALIVAAVGFSRIYLGLHYPTDVLAGWCVGGMLVLACYPHILRRQSLE